MYIENAVYKYHYHYHYCFLCYVNKKKTISLPDWTSAVLSKPPVTQPIIMIIIPEKFYESAMDLKWCYHNVILDTFIAARAGLPSLYQQRLQNIAIFMYKVKNGLVPTYITEIFNTAPKRYNLRNADFNIPRFRTVRYGKHSLRYFGPHLWNKLEQSDRENPNFKSFKNSIKSKDLSLLIDNCRNCDICC